MALARGSSWLSLLSLLARGTNVLRWVVRIALLLLVVDLFYLYVTWPDWQRYARGAVPKSNFMAEYERRRAEDPQLPRPRWQPVPYADLPRHLTRAVVLAEDSRFWEHKGFDLIAFKEAMSYNWSERRFALGASTISQQTVKNLFLTRSKDPLRKWHELVLSWGMERHLSKTRILEIYLNVVEFGQGIYGVQAAAQAYWGMAARDLTLQQAVELVATLPAPIKNNPATRTEAFERRASKIQALIQRFPGEPPRDKAPYPSVVAPVSPGT
ncbi:MAG: monofunctional biosynthetic peptidoglycan transglycosylase [Pseudomonadota bacterium]|nr:MAG: monofunctional biosynthetic peptidoglycan transglycosylase [Pseudomonadota bacterium]